MDSSVVVSWPGPEAGWRLQATTDLRPAGTVWTDLPPPYATSGPNFIFIDANPVGNRFFRLRKP